ncbi:MAG: hypothetical protein M1812_001619 [Candelaria pacifica]|nr:MAG: hypothetical protein M1812_001619 [Candelaria pacifica]
MERSSPLDSVKKPKAVMRFSLLAITIIVASALASPTLRHVVHEKRNRLPVDWFKRSRPEGHLIIPMRIALTQSNLHLGDEFLMNVADPSSPNFGRHWNAKEVAEKFAPSKETVAAVEEWLAHSDIPLNSISTSQGLNWLNFNITVSRAESLLKTQYHVYQHATGQPHIACESYSIPETLREHVDFITPTVHFDAKIGPRKSTGSQKRAGLTAAIGTQIRPGVATQIGKPGSGSLPKPGPQINIEDVELQQCDRYITPNCLRALYRFSPGVSANPKNSFGIVEYSPQSYLQTDLDLFFRNFSSAQVGTSPRLASIDGGAPQTANLGFELNGESDLDLEYAMTLVYPQTVTLYQVGDNVEGASFNNFLDAIDASYCTENGGDDPFQDATYPDPNPGGYMGPENCGGFAATNVISTSYGFNEADLTVFYERRQCNEYMKLGLQGVTVLYSSGDYGVAGNRGQCIDPNTRQLNNGTSGLFNPSFPSTCPYVTAVGATQINPGSSVSAPESACQQTIFSGGGFSNVFDLPDYQASAVRGFLSYHSPPYGAERFNNSGRTRGYPDVSANGANYVVTVDGKFSTVFGTSASAPTFGSVITLVNEQRYAMGKGPVGFLNPTLYAHPEVLFDITSGGNRGCGTPGFTATQGWDPVTGLGTPNTPALMDLYLGLP